MKAARHVLIAAIVLSMLLACQDPEISPAPPSSTPEQGTVCPATARTPTSVPRAEEIAVSTAEVETATVSTAAARDTPTTSSQKCLRDRIVFISKVRGQTDLWWITSDGANLEQLTNDKWIERNPRWSPDGEKLSYSSTLDGAYELWQLPCEGCVPSKLTDTANGARDALR